jgi:hypothetical protein
VVWTTGVHFLAGAKIFSLLHSIQTDSEAHPVSYQIGTRYQRSYPQGESGEGMKLTLHIYLVPWLGVVELYLHFPYAIME